MSQIVPHDYIVLLSVITQQGLRLQDSHGGHVYQHQISHTESNPARQNLIEHKVGRVVNMYSKEI